VTDGRAPAAPHLDLASYALGVLGDEETSRFEEHLATCEACGEQLESFLPVIGMLPEVPLSTVDLPPRVVALDDDMRARHRGRAGLRSQRAGVGALASSTRNALRRPVVAASAAAVAAAAVTAGVFSEFAYDEIVTTSSAGAVPSAAVSPWSGLRGPDLENGRRLEATDPGTGVHAEMVLDTAAWGTKVSFALSRLPGPQNCRLVAVRQGGDEQVLSSWVVPPEGYGEPSQPRSLVLQAATALNRADIVSLRVDAVGQGATWPLVTVPV
jgi:hypothetical protein